jgi:hypothetical protein
MQVRDEVRMPGLPFIERRERLGLGLRRATSMRGITDCRRPEPSPPGGGISETTRVVTQAPNSPPGQVVAGHSGC